MEKNRTKTKLFTFNKIQFMRTLFMNGPYIDRN